MEPTRRALRTRLAWLAGALLACALVLSGLPAFDNDATAAKSKSSFSGGKSSSSSGSKSSGSGWSSSSQPKAPPAAPSGSSSGSSGSQPPGSSSSSPSSSPSASPSSKSSEQPSSGQPSSGQPSSGWSNAAGAAAGAGAGAGAASSSQASQQKSSFSGSGQSSIKKESSLKAYNEYNAKFSKTGNPVSGQATAGQPPPPPRTWDNYQNYRTDRDNYYTGRGFSAPAYSFRSYSSFGLWDAMFLWFMIRSASGPSFMYNHQNDPGVQAFKKEADKLAEDNTELKKQLAEVNAKVDQLKKEGKPVDPQYIPKDVDPALALAADRVVKEPDQAPKKEGGSKGIGMAVLALGVLGVLAFILVRRKLRTG